MSTLSLLFGLAAALATCLSSVAVWAPRRPSAKLAALALAALFLPLGYVAQAELLGRPKPVGLAWLEGADEARVLAAVAEEGRRILVWLQPEGGSEPRAYALPWSRPLAEQLQQAQRQSTETGTEMRMRAPFAGEASLDAGEPRFYAAPQQALPPKAGMPAPRAFVRP